MNCPFCQGDSRVIDSRPSTDGIRRRRECGSCLRRFTTHEKIVPVEVRVIKSLGRPVEEFNPAKLLGVIQRVCKGRGIPFSNIEDIARKIEALIIDRAKSSIQSQEIAEMLLIELKSLDQIAYHRFAVNYMDDEGRIYFKTLQRTRAKARQYSLFGDSE